MHMRGSRFYSKLAAIALSYFFNAPRALISRPPNCENFQTTAGRPKVRINPLTGSVSHLLGTSAIADKFRHVSYVSGKTVFISYFHYYCVTRLLND